jgi:hypothetical protein
VANSRLAAFRLKAAIAARTLGPIQESAERKILFIVGTGRSGTHFLTRCLIGHPQITDLMGGEENPLVFKTITAAALSQSDADRSLAEAAKVYDSLADLARPKWLVDQCHPNIWFVDHWSEAYVSARFVGILRNPFSVVASMMKHPAVRAWSVDWHRYPIPNPFLGITTDNARRYEKMSLAERCTMRWIGHYRKMLDLRGSHDRRFLCIVYEELCKQPETCLSAVADWLGLVGEFQIPLIDGGALTRGADMPVEDAAAIARLLEEFGVEEGWRQPPW